MLEQVVELAIEAGKKTLEFYRKDVQVETKADASPLTEADKASHETIMEGLASIDPDLPVLSEESRDTDPAERGSWTRFFLVDPLDGTKEFVKGLDEFTVNIAVIDGGRPVLGVVYSPVLEITYAAAEGQGAYRVEKGERRDLRTRRTDAGKVVLMQSRSHAGEALQAVLDAHPEVESRAMGSSFKFGLVAEGEADLYPRLGPTMEWDTAAAQCVVEEAGGKVLRLDGTPLAYNKDVLQNPEFVVVGDPDFDWRGFLAPGLARIEGASAS